MRFIIATDPASLSTAGRNALTAFLEGKGWSVWHWFQDLWLIDAGNDSPQLDLLREDIIKVVPAKSPLLVIMSTEGTRTFTGVVPADGVAWIHEHWQHPKKK